MIRLKSINIKGFKDPSYEKNLDFSSEPISVIYGQNGCGKTTLLKILFAVFSRNEQILLQENVVEIHISYEKEENVFELVIKKNIETNSFDWSENFDIYGTSSILFGVHRGVVQEPFELGLKNNNHRANTSTIDPKMLLTFAQDIYTFAHPSYMRYNRSIELKDVILELAKPNPPLKKGIKILTSILNELERSNNVITNGVIYRRILKIQQQLLPYKDNSSLQTVEESSFLKTLDNQAHISTDFVNINDIKKSIINQYNKGQKILSEKIQKAFFETIEQAVEIDEKQEDFILPADFDARIKEHKEFILNAIPTEKSSLTDRINGYLETNDKSLTKSKIFRAMLLNIVESAEEENPTLETIDALIKMFNDHLYGNKKLIVTSEQTYIQLENGNTHELNELSSGERNLLSILTLFLIIGNDRDFLMIDEPEISLNIKWQRDFLPLLSKLNSKAQIIVASHSPSIAHKNSKYLVELI